MILRKFEGLEQPCGTRGRSIGAALPVKRKLMEETGMFMLRSAVR